MWTKEIRNTLRTKDTFDSALMAFEMAYEDLSMRLSTPVEFSLDIPEQHVEQVLMHPTTPKKRGC